MRSRLGGAWRIDVGAGSVDGGSEARRERRIRSHCIVVKAESFHGRGQRGRKRHFPAL